MSLLLRVAILNKNVVLSLNNLFDNYYSCFAACSSGLEPFVLSGGFG